MDIIASLYSALAADSDLTALLDAFEDAPAIFSGDALPASFVASDLPYIWIRQPHAAANNDTFSSFARTIELDVSFYALASESSSAIDEAVEAARLTLHRKNLGTDDDGPFCTVSGPLLAPTSRAEIAGRRLSARLQLRG